MRLACADPGPTKTGSAVGGTSSSATMLLVGLNASKYGRPTQ